MRQSWIMFPTYLPVKRIYSVLGIHLKRPKICENCFMDWWSKPMRVRSRWVLKRTVSKLSVGGSPPSHVVPGGKQRWKPTAPTDDEPETCMRPNDLEIAIWIAFTHTSTDFSQKVGFSARTVKHKATSSWRLKDSIPGVLFKVAIGENFLVKATKGTWS